MKLLNPTRIGAAWAAILAAALALDAQAAELPPEHLAGVASYVSGGIGDGQEALFKSSFKRYPLVVELYRRSGSRNEYTADAVVKIAPGGGAAAIEAKADGPFMLIRLPAGEYRIGATLDGRTLPEQRVQVTDSGHRTATFVFPAAGS